MVATAFVETVEARRKDAGAFLRLTAAAHKPCHAAAEIAAGAVAEHLLPRWLPRWQTACHPVLGDIFNDDLISVRASPSLRVIVCGTGASLDRVYALYRPYGRISAIEYLPLAPLSSSSPSSLGAVQCVRVTYTTLAAAVCARNCTYNYCNDGSTFRPDYEDTRVFPVRTLLAFFAAHPRVFLPAAVAIALTLTVWVFDPVRVFLMRCLYSPASTLEILLEDLGLAQSSLIPALLKSAPPSAPSENRQTPPASSSASTPAPAPNGPAHGAPGASGSSENVAHSVHSHTPASADNAHCCDMSLTSPRGNDFADSAELAYLRSQLARNPEQVIYITGAASSGKSLLALTAAKLAPGSLLVDFESIVKAANAPSEFASLLAGQLGYRPYFPIFSRLLALLDALFVAATGTRATSMATGATSRAGSIDAAAGNGANVNPPPEHADIPAMLQCAGRALRDIVVTAGQNPGDGLRKPVVVIDNFMCLRSDMPYLRQTYGLVATWASRLVETGVAHVLVVNSSSSGCNAIGIDEISRMLQSSSRPPLIVALNQMPQERAMHMLMKAAAAGRALRAPSPSMPMANANAPSTLKNDARLGEAQGSLVGSVAALECRECEVAWDDKSVRAAAEAVGFMRRDVLLLGARLRAGETPEEALSRMTAEASAELVRAALQGQHRERAWGLLCQLLGRSSERAHSTAPAAAASSYARIMAAAATLGHGAASTLRLLEEREILHVDYTNGVPTRVRVARPLLARAAQALFNDGAYACAMDGAMYRAMAAAERERLLSAEGRFGELARALRAGTALRGDALAAIELRIMSLARAITKMQANIERWTALEAKSLG